MSVCFAILSQIGVLATEQKFTSPNIESKLVDEEFNVGLKENTKKEEIEQTKSAK